MGPRTVISYSLLLCFFVDIGICSSSAEERSLRFSDSTLPTDIATESTKTFTSSQNNSSKRHRRVPNETYEEDEEEDVDGAPPDHVVPYSEHEDPEEPSTKPKYTNPGDWAKPPPDKDIPLDFVPTKLYAQVRGTHTVKRVPREEAIETAETAEELLSAPRLREVVSKSKKNTIYTEEGYEDSAYDHAGHVRDADFHEGFARKLDDERKSKQGGKKKPISDEREEIKNEESTDEELNEYDDDYRDHVEESVRVEETKPVKRGKKKAKEIKFKGIWQDPDINPKKVTENEIERLEEDLENEYAHSEKNVEDQVPENLRSYEDAAEDSNSEQDSTNDYDYGKQMDKSIAESREASRELVKNRTGERLKSVKNEYPVASSTKSGDLRGSISTTLNPTGFRRGIIKPAAVYENSESFENLPGELSSTSLRPTELRKYANPAGFASYENFQSLPGTSSTTPNYGKVFWDYFKLVRDKWKPKQVSTPGDITTTTTEAVKLVPEEMTRVPAFSSVHTTLRDFDTFSFSPPTTELRDFVFAGSSMDPIFPRAGSVYESWKRQDREAYSQESPEFGSLEAASNSYPIEFETTTKVQEDPAVNTERDDTSTLVTPKKLSYTVIIRSNDKTTTKSPPCDREVHKRPKETNSLQLTSPRNPKMLKYLKDQLSPQEINDIAVKKHQDFKQPPLQVPLRQVTYTDFLPDTYASPVRQSVTHESGQPGKKVNGGRDRYNVLESPHDKRFLNPYSHASEAPHFHHHHHHRGHQSFSGPKRSHRSYPPTKLLPPSPVVRSSYADYLGFNRPGNPRTRFNRSPRFDPWTDLFQLYQSIDRSIFGRRRRRSLSRVRNNEEPRNINRRQYQRTVTSNDRGKINLHSFDASAEKKLQPERNLFYDAANRLVALDAVGIVHLSGDEKFPREKSSAIRTRRNHEDLLNESPKFAEEEINAEIESRFENEEEEEEKYDNSEEKERGKVDVEVPDFDVSEVIESNKNEKIISNRPINANKLDVEKYPFYENSRVPNSSALKYITNPRQVPRKTLGGTEFYDSRDRYLECDEVEPNLESVVPEEEVPMSDRERKGDEPRLSGLGDKLDCFRAKYFDKNPLDNPLFLEKQIDQPRAPKEFDPAKFASRIFDIPSKNQETRDVVKRVSRRPETDLRRSGSKRNQVTKEDDQISRKANNEIPKREKEQSTKNPRSRRKRPQSREQKKNPEQMSGEPPQHYPVTPYQRQVYEDVMGTIKNLAGMYQAYGETVPSVQSNVNYVPVDLREKDWNFQGVRLTEKPRSFLIHGLLPPQTTAASEHHLLPKYRVIPYRTNKVSYRTRSRAENPPGSEGVRLGYFKTVRVHKRSVDDSKVSREQDMDIEESRNIAVRDMKNPTSSSSLKSETLQGTEKEEKPAPSERVVYTIRDRIRYSKPRHDFGKIGKFSNLEAAGTEDVRRQEPRYNRIRRKKVPPSTTIDPSNTTNEGQVPDVESTASALKPLSEQGKTKGRQDFHDEPGEIYKIQFSTTRGTQTAPTADRRRDDEELADDEEDYEEEKESEESRNDEPQKNNYDVHENVEEDVTTVASLNVEPTRSPEFYKLQDYLQSEPPGYSETFTESSTEPTSRYKGNTNKEDEEEEEADDEDEERPKKFYQRAETRRDDEQEEKEDEEQGGDEQVERPSESYADEEPSPRSEEAEDAPDAPASESYKNAEDDEEETKDDESSHDGEKEFHRFASRPYSPFESYEDPKYADLGPRLSKPSFYHPTFSKPTSSKKRRREYSAESEDGSDEEGSEKTTRYVFPWEQDEAEGVEESKNSRHSIGRYEYPWEKRERLAKERRRKEKARREYEKLFGYPYDPDDDEEAEEQNGSNTNLHGRRVYPWEHYDVPSKNHNRRKPSRNSQIIDNIEVGTEYRPVTKFSSRYKSRMFNLNDDGDPFFGSGADPSEIRVSVIESIKKASDTPAVDPIKVLKNIVQVNGSGVATTTAANPYRVSGAATSTKASKRLRNWKTPSISIISTVEPTTTTRPTRTGARPRTWRVASTTTKKPIRSRKRVIGNELLKSGSQNTEFTTTIPVTKNDSNSSSIMPLKTTTPAVVIRKIRRRGQTIKRSHNSTATTVRPVRRRLPKSTAAPKAVEETTLKTVTERTTTPKSKTVEHRSSFSKEEIITKTSYPRMVNDEDKEEGSKDSSKNERKGKDLKKSNNMMNESVKKVSIVTKETPEHIYRTEEVDRDGVKGMFVSITPNNGTSTSMDSMEGPEDRTIDDEETKEMLKSFEDFDDKDNEEEAGSSVMQDSHLMANLLRQVPPFMNDLTFDESFQGGGNNFLDTEGSGDGESDEDAPDHSRHESRAYFEKNPSKRLYYYVEN